MIDQQVSRLGARDIAEPIVTTSNTGTIIEASDDLWQTMKPGCRAFMALVVTMSRDSLVAPLADMKRILVPSLSILMVCYVYNTQSRG